jgi:5S rRNA maturation endonuclease (ribonuclease M5)/KaiC/GvpD/RAD55 family RecA-like ATPase
VSKIDELKAHPDAYRLYASRVQLKRNGDYWIGHCPMHTDNRESLSVFWQDGVLLWKCHANCGSGNSVQFVAAVDHLTLPQAVKRCEDELSSSWSSEKTRVEQVFKPLSSKPKEYKSIPASDYARAEKNFMESAAAQEFLKSRGISVETARKLHVGFKQDVGRLAGDGNQDIADKGWLVFPCFEGDRVVGLKYRSIVRKAFCRQPGFKSALFNADSIDLFEPVIVVEGELDCLSLAEIGLRSVSITSASTIPSTEELDKIASASNVYLAVDSDSAGQKAMERLKKVIPNSKEILWEAGCKDANDVLVKKCRKNTSQFAKIVKEAMTQALVSPLPGVIDAVEALKYTTFSESADDPSRLRFPWKKVDAMCVLLPGAVVTVYATQTGCGKTTFCNQVAVHNAKERGDVVLSYQAELPFTAMNRLIASHVLRKDRRKLEDGDGPRAAEKLAGLKYYIGRDTSISTHDQVLDLIESAVKHLGVTVVILDHFHAFQSSSDAAKEASSQSKTMQRITRIAHEFGLHFFVVSQPRKSDQQHERKKAVNISAIKGSESLTSAADMVIGLHRDVLDDSSFDPRTEVHCIKAREEGGGERKADLMLDGKICTFFEIEPRADEPPPQSDFFA